MPEAPPITHYVVLLAQPAEENPPLRPIARLTQEDEETIRRKLQTTTFEVLSRFARRANAEGLHQQLHALGVQNIVVSDQDIRGHLIVAMKSANAGAGGIAFKDCDNKPLYCPFDDIAEVALLEVSREDGSVALLVDLVRKSANITPRLLADQFDFSALVQKPGAGVEHFLDTMEGRTGNRTNRLFGEARAQLISASRDFASRPVLLCPPQPSPFQRHDLDAANAYSFVESYKYRA